MFAHEMDAKEGAKGLEDLVICCVEPLLYAVGEITGGFFYHNYPSGTGLVRGAVMGRIAGAEAAADVV